MKIFCTLLIIIPLLIYINGNPNEADTVKLNDGLKFDVYRVDLNKSKVDFYRTGENQQDLQSISSLKDYLYRRSKELYFATNGGMYRPDYSPEGLYVENGREIYPLNMSQKGRLDFMNFYDIPPNGVFLITKNNKAYIVTKEDYQSKVDKTQVKYATQSGPMVYVNGERNPKFNKASSSKYVRSGVGITKQGKLMFAISHEPVSFWNFSRIFAYYGCENALYLDGGVSEMYLPRLDKHRTNQKFGSIIAVTGNR